MLNRSINDIFYRPPSFLRMGTRALLINITLRMTQGNCVGVIYLGVTDVSTMYRSVLLDKISHIGHLS